MVMTMKTEACDWGPSNMASACAGTPLAGRAHHGDCGRRTFIPVSVRQDRAVRMRGGAQAPLDTASVEVTNPSPQLERGEKEGVKALYLG